MPFTDFVFRGNNRDLHRATEQVRRDFREVGESAQRAGRVGSQSTRATVAALVREQRALRETMHDAQRLARVAKQGSDTQVVANRLAADSARKLGVAYDHSADRARHNVDQLTRAERRLGSATRGAIAGSGAFHSFGRSIAFASGAFLGGAGLIHVLRRSIELAASEEKVFERTKIVFRESAKDVVAWSKTTLRSFGLTDDAAAGLANNLGAILQPMGVAPKRAADLSKSLVELAADMGSIRDVDPEKIFSAFQAGIVGRTRGLKQYGIIIDESRLKAEALRLGLVKSKVDFQRVADAETSVAVATQKLTVAQTKHGRGSLEARAATTGLHNAQRTLKNTIGGSIPALDSQAKALATASLIMKDGASSSGAFERQSGKLQNIMRVLRGSIEEVAEGLGKALLPSIKDVAGSMADWLSKTENQQKVVAELRKAVELVRNVFRTVWPIIRTTAGVIGDANSAVGGLNNSLKILFGVWAIRKLAGLRREMLLTQAAAAAASGPAGVGGIRRSVIGLSLLRAAIPITVSYLIIRKITGSGADLSDVAGGPGDLIPIWRNGKWTDPISLKPVRNQDYWNRRFRYEYPGRARPAPGTGIAKQPPMPTTGLDRQAREGGPAGGGDWGALRFQASKRGIAGLASALGNLSASWQKTADAEHVWQRGLTTFSAAERARRGDLAKTADAVALLTINLNKTPTKKQIIAEVGLRRAKEFFAELARLDKGADEAGAKATRSLGKHAKGMGDAARSLGASANRGLREGTANAPAAVVAAVGRAISGITKRKPEAERAGREVGTGAKTGFGSGLFGASKEATEKTHRAVTAIAEKTEAARGAGRLVGVGAKHGVGQGMEGVGREAGTKADAVAAALREKKLAARTAGSELGGAAKEGILAGLVGLLSRVGRSLWDAVSGAFQQTRQRLPSIGGGRPLATGGRVPGPANRDHHLALLAGREFVVTGGGERILEAMTGVPGVLDWLEGVQPPHFAKGGRVEKPGRGGGKFGSLPRVEQASRILNAMHAGRLSRPLAEAAWGHWKLGDMRDAERVLGASAFRRSTERKREAVWKDSPSVGVGLLRALDALIGSPIGLGIRPSKILGIRDRARHGDVDAMVTLGALVASGGRTGSHAALTAGERKALLRYRSPGTPRSAEHLNPALRRGDKLGGREIETVQELSALLARRKLSEPTTLYRGVKADPRAVFGARTLAGLVGKTKREQAFMSTSRSRGAAEAFAGDKGFLLVLNVPKGVGAISMDEIKRGSLRGKLSSMRSPGERETLLERGLGMHVTRVVPRRDGLGRAVSPVVHASVRRMQTGGRVGRVDSLADAAREVGHALVDAVEKAAKRRDPTVAALRQREGLAPLPRGGAAAIPTSRSSGDQASSRRGSAALINLAKSFIGTPYVWGGAAPGGFDCSGFVQYVFGKFGISVPRTTYDQVKAGKPVALNKLKPGDAVFSRPGPRGPEHEALYAGSGQVLVARRRGTRLQYQSLSSFGAYTARRFADLGGDVGDPTDPSVPKAPKRTQFLTPGLQRGLRDARGTASLRDDIGALERAMKFLEQLARVVPKAMRESVQEQLKGLREQRAGLRERFAPVRGAQSLVRRLVGRPASEDRRAGIEGGVGAIRGHAGTRAQLRLIDPALRPNLQREIRFLQTMISNAVTPREIAAVARKAKELSDQFQQKLQLTATWKRERQEGVAEADGMLGEISAAFAKPDVLPLDVLKDKIAGLRDTIAHGTREAVKAAKQQLARLAPTVSASVSAAQEAAQARIGRFQTAFGRVSQRILTGFDRATSRGLAAIRRNVEGQIRSIQQAAASATPGETALTDFQKARAARDFQRSMRDAQQRLAEAQASGDQQAILEAQEAIQNLLLDQQERALEERAAAEREAADRGAEESIRGIEERAAAEEAEYQDMRDNLRTHLEDRLALWAEELQNETKTIGEFAAWLKGEGLPGGLLEGVEMGDPTTAFEEGGRAAGSAFVRGFSAELAKLGETIANLGEESGPLATPRFDIPGAGGGVDSMQGRGDPQQSGTKFGETSGAISGFSRKLTAALRELAKVIEEVYPSLSERLLKPIHFLGDAAQQAADQIDNVRGSLLLLNGQSATTTHTHNITNNITNRVKTVSVDSFDGDGSNPNPTGACFVTGTLVDTPDGSRPIESIAVGDSVLCWDFETERFVATAVVETFEHVEDDERGVLYVNDGERRVLVTPEHPFWTGERWVTAGSLIAGDTLQTRYGGDLFPVEVKSVVALEGKQPVYNLHVAHADHNYVAGGFVVHNMKALGDGALVRSPIRALLGEKGPEAVIPLPDLERIMVRAADVSVRASDVIGPGRAGGGGGQTNIVTIQNPTFLTGDRQAAKDLARSIKAEIDRIAS